MNGPAYTRPMINIFHSNGPRWAVAARQVLCSLFPYVLIFLACVLVLHKWLSANLQWDAIVDLPSHYIRSYLLNNALIEGHIYPKWFSSLFYGYGYPLLLFTPPSRCISSHCFLFLTIPLSYSH